MIWRFLRWLWNPHPCPASPEREKCRWVYWKYRGDDRRFCYRCSRTQMLVRHDTYEPDWCWETI